ncbi:ATP-dependent Clp protease adapter ClpS [Marivibrio halodurans]|uniref:ATP-dependent Clp protease adapter protein ClpS n=1 Tax=Marivibrio halodurans TaxID=2039722 RepID=A0A8J7S2S6_9PROT|nr:ATP-dependent Clp protease adapter ClpS [Marivibrio halodurans]MBP5857609.1 ATP-dependent Clp protease adapter ClpS [Marivibrio halodurans]
MTERPHRDCPRPLPIAVSTLIVRAGDDEGVDDPRAPTGPGGAVVTKTKPKTKKPSMYKVLMLNDDYTPMEFVVYVLERFFSKTRDEATQIMLHVHHRGVGICGVYTYEVAETKVTQVMDTARKEGHPLQCTLEKDA